MSRHRLQSVLMITMGSFVIGFLATAAFGFLKVPLQKPPADWHYVAPHASVPRDGIARQYAIRVEERDAWCVGVDRVARTIFVMRLAECGTVRAFETYHSFNGMKVPLEYLPDQRVFHSYCRSVFFDVEGKLLDENARDFADDMISLPVKYDRGGIWVRVAEAN